MFIISLMEKEPHYGGTTETGAVAGIVAAKHAHVLILASRDKLMTALIEGEKVFEEIALDLIPDQVERSQSIAIRTIAHAARLLLEPDVYRVLADRNMARGSERGRKRSGFDKQPGALRRAMESAGLVKWEETENARLEELAITVLHSTSTNHAGHPDYQTIAEILNDEFHSGELIRNRNGSRLQHWKLRNERLGSEERKRRRAYPWNNLEEKKMLLTLAATVYRHGRGRPRPGAVDWQTIADQLNQRFHVKELQSDVHIRTPQACVLAARRFGRKVTME